MKWTAPPTRRELTLLLFCFTAFFLGYNLEVSLATVGLDVPQRATISKKLTRWNEEPQLEKDGRKPKAWRDKLEKQIVGDWNWGDKQVMQVWEDDGDERGWQRYGYNFSKLRDKDIIWKLDASVLGPQLGMDDMQRIGPRTPQDEKVVWGGNVPTSRVVAHTPGFTILDNIIYAGGTVYIISDEPQSLPLLGDIVSSSADPSLPPREIEWQVLSPKLAPEILGDHAAKINGVTFMATDPSYLQDNYTLVSLWRTYSTLDPNISETGSSLLPPPLRLIFPNIVTYSDVQPKPQANDPEIVRVRSRSGVHPFLIKTAFPTIGVWYAEDWQDLKGMEKPFLLERIVIGDRGAADRAGLENGLPLWSNPFVRMETSENWWAPVRRTLTAYLGLDDEEDAQGKRKSSKSPKPVVTYISRQNEPTGPRLRGEDHQSLVDVLKGLERHYGYEVHLLSDSGSNWNERMSAIARSTIVLSVYGDHLVDSVFMRPSPHATLMEFFPSGTFVRDRELPTRTLGIQYIAWWNDRKFSGNSLPPATRLPDYSLSEEISIDAAAIAQAVREELSRRL